MSGHLSKKPNRLNRVWSAIRLCWIAIALLAGATVADAQGEKADLASYEKSVLPILEKYCVGCHGPETQKARYRLDTLEPDIDSSHLAQQWREALDMLNLEEMPPEDEDQPTRDEVLAVTNWIETELRRAEIQLQSTGRKVVLRRLNRDEYMNTMRDLLGIDHPDWKTELPLDGKAGGFDTVGSAHSMSATALQKYLVMADWVVEEAFARPKMKVEYPSRSHRFEAEDHATRGFGGFKTAEFRYQQSLKNVLGGAVPGGRPFLQAHPELEKAVATGRPTNPEERAALKQILQKELAIAREMVETPAHSNLSTTPMIYRSPTDVRLIRYWYYNTRPGLELNFDRLPPGDYRVRVRARGVAYPGAPLSRTIWMRLIERKKTAKPLWTQDVAESDEFQIYETDLRIEKGLKLWLELAERIERGGSTPSKPGDPNLVIDWVEVEGPTIDASGHESLFSGWDGNPTREAARDLLGRFMKRAWRRPVTEAEIDRALPLIDVSSRESFDESLKTALRYVLSNPNFLYLVEPKTSTKGEREPLDDFELASRLSYFLWSSPPDETLIGLAETMQLSQPGVLKAQVERMLADPRSAALDERFTGQWLELEKLSPLMPDAKLYPGYDDFLVQSMEAEPQAFFREILEHDLSVLNFLDSDFAMLNERLARHYGINGVSGGEFRKVALPASRQRGGLLGQGAILTLTSNGTRTSPVIRGKWILENLLDDPPTPPPPNVSALEEVPDIEGQDKLTVRQLLEKHREVASCYGCHRKIDPYGLALENFDAVGAWRTHEMDFDNRERALVPRQEVVVKDELPQGGAFEGLDEFKALLLADQDRFLECLAEKMLTYALGRTMEFTDESAVEDLVDTMAANDLTLRSLIHGIVQHEVFRTK